MGTIKCSLLRGGTFLSRKREGHFDTGWILGETGSHYTNEIAVTASIIHGPYVTILTGGTTCRSRDRMPGVRGTWWGVSVSWAKSFRKLRSLEVESKDSCTAANALCTTRSCIWMLGWETDVKNSLRRDLRGSGLGRGGVWDPECLFPEENKERTF